MSKIIVPKDMNKSHDDEKFSTNSVTVVENHLQLIFDIHTKSDIENLENL